MFKSIAPFIYAVIVVAYFIMLGLKLDEKFRATHMVLFGPLIGGQIFLEAWLVFLIVIAPNGVERAYIILAMLVNSGSIASQVLLTLKADARLSISYVSGLMPFAVVILAAAIGAAYLSEYREVNRYRSVPQTVSGRFRRENYR